MARPTDVPPCVADAAVRARIWRLAKRINQRHAKGRRRPLTASTLGFLNWVLYEAPRRDGGLWHSEETMSAKSGIPLRTLQRAKAALASWRLILVHPRLVSALWPVRSGARICAIRKGMRTSDAITFPNLRSVFPVSRPQDFRPRQFGAGGKARFSSLLEVRGDRGRFLAAAARRRLEELLRNKGEGEALVPPGQFSLRSAGGLPSRAGLTGVGGASPVGSDPWLAAAAGFAARAGDVR